MLRARTSYLQADQLSAPMNELRPIPGYEGLYSVTEDGRIWSLPKAYGRGRHQGRWLQPGTNEHGYQVVVLVEEGRKATVRCIGLSHWLGFRIRRPCPW